jgi:glycosyltransferase involved in cell wall biosynthesis
MQLELYEASQPGLVSIVIPCYNAERFLTETLNGAFAQSYPRTEVILIDDGSTDGTADVIRSYSDRVKAEFGPNRDRGTALAPGEFLQYLDADDLPRRARTAGGRTAGVAPMSPPPTARNSSRLTKARSR